MDVLHSSHELCVRFNRYILAVLLCNVCVFPVSNVCMPCNRLQSNQSRFDSATLGEHPMAMKTKFTFGVGECEHNLTRCATIYLLCNIRSL